MKKAILLLLVVVAVSLFAGCMSSQEDNEEAYLYLTSNIDDNEAIKAYLENEAARGNDIDAKIKNGDTILMIAARFTTNIEVIRTIASYYPSIHQMNYKTDMTAIDYLTRREGTKEMVTLLAEESVKQELRNKANETKDSIVKGIFSKF